jgi:short-subunit dehydrogenase
MQRPVALVTGASVGLGAEFARQLAQRGNDLVLVARDRGRLEALAKELDASHGAKAEVLAADLTDLEQLASIEARVRNVDIVVNNAGFGTFGKFHELDIETEVREINLNVTALSRLTHAAADAMASRGEGGILNVASLAAFQPGPNNAIYSASKAFVYSFSQAVHEEMRGTGVAVTVLCPGFTRTEFQERANVPANEVPNFLWHEPPQVVTCGLDALAKNKAVAVPGAMYKVLGAFSSMAPDSITRRMAGTIVRRADR